MKVLALTTNTHMMACPRFRMYQYIPALAQAGIEVEVRPFLDRRLEDLLYQPGALLRKTLGMAAAALRRPEVLPSCLRADLVYVLREASLLGPPLLEWALSRLAGKPLVFDLDDALWESYVSPTHGPLAMLLKMPGKTHTLFKLARRVVAGNQYVADYARRFNTNVSVVPTVVDTQVFTPARSGNANRLPVVGWIGSHSTLQHLLPILPALAGAARRCRFRLLIVGAGKPIRVPGVEVENRQWRLDTEVSCFQELDIGLYPLNADNWSIGKSAFKAVQYGAVGIPTVGSPVGAVSSLIHDQENGLMASTPDEWADSVVRLVQDKALRRQLGARARALVESDYSTQTWAARLAGLLRSTVSE